MAQPLSFRGQDKPKKDKWGKVLPRVYFRFPLYRFCLSSATRCVTQLSVARAWSPGARQPQFHYNLLLWTGGGRGGEGEIEGERDRGRERQGERAREGERGC